METCDSWHDLVSNCMSICFCQQTCDLNGLCQLCAGVLELMDFIRKENIKTLLEHIVEQHIQRLALRTCHAAQDSVYLVPVVMQTVMSECFPALDPSTHIV